jgi:hypothetical protein
MASKRVLISARHSGEAYITDLDVATIQYVDIIFACAARQSLYDDDGHFAATHVAGLAVSHRRGRFVEL